MTNSSLYCTALSAIVVLESPTIAPFTPRPLIHYVEYAMSALETYAPFSPSINGGYWILRNKVETIKMHMF
jgi:hypothetical protein